MTNPTPNTKPETSREIAIAILQHMPGFKGPDGFEIYYQARLREAAEVDVEEKVAK